MSTDNRTEQPTPRRRSKAREQGQVPRSRDLVSNLALTGSWLLCAYTAGSFALHWRRFFRIVLAQGAVDRGYLSGIGSGLWKALQPAALLMVLTWLVAALAATVQGGFVFAPAALALKPERLQPGPQLKRLFSVSALGQLGKSVIPVIVMLALAASLFSRDWRAMLYLSRRGAPQLTLFLLKDAFEIGWRCALVLLSWAGIDYLLERRKHEAELRMSRQEIIDEHKEMEGNPAIKARIRRLQRQVRRRRMLRDVERAAVVIANPTHFAVAIEYRIEMPAPVVVAKGRNLLAQQIRQVALWNQVPIIENPPLAQTLFRIVEVGQAIPAKLYAVVAEVLAMVWRAQIHAELR